jgi:hypothetical protein
MAEELHEDVRYTDTGRRSRDCGNDLEDIGQSTTEIINIDTSYQPRWDQQRVFGNITRTGTWSLFPPAI